MRRNKFVKNGTALPTLAGSALLEVVVLRKIPGGNKVAGLCEVPQRRVHTRQSVVKLGASSLISWIKRVRGCFSWYVSSPSTRALLLGAVYSSQSPMRESETPCIWNRW